MVVLLYREINCSGHVDIGTSDLIPQNIQFFFFWLSLTQCVLDVEQNEVHRHLGTLNLVLKHDVTTWTVQPCQKCLRQLLLAIVAKAIERQAFSAIWLAGDFYLIHN